MKPEEIDRILCEWSMEFQIALTEKALNTLVDRIALAAAPILENENEMS